MSVLQIHLYSDTLKLQMEVWAILPDARAFDAPDRKYKVLWLMPSGSCDCTDWIRHSDIERMALARNLAVILPGMHRSCCTNMAMGPKYGDWAALELPAALRRMLPLLSPRREDNFVAGFSNGGYGCFYLAMNYPQVYGAAAGLPPATRRTWTGLRAIGRPKSPYLARATCIKRIIPINMPPRSWFKTDSQHRGFSMPAGRKIHGFI